LVVEFPDYAVLARPTPLSVDEVQAQLGASEALVLFLDTPEMKRTPEETFIWVVTRTDMRWVRSELGTPALTREVAALRCGLDDALWNNIDSTNKCVEMVKKYRYDATIDGQFVQVLPFDLGRAHALYKSAVRPDRGSHARQALPACALRAADAAAVSGVGDRTGRQRRTSSCVMACAQACDHRTARRLLAEGVATRGEAQRGDQAHDRVRQPAARWRSK
jgi:hypothetical protein